MKTKLMNLVAAAALAAGTAMAATTAAGTYTDSEIANKAAHEIRMYTRYTIWDNVNLKVHEGQVVLSGEVSQPFKKDDLRRLVQSVPGVQGVTNELQVLPLSMYDDELRIRVARAIYRDSVLSRYAIQPTPPIHIIVANGQVRLEGVVNNEMEKNVAGMRASGAGLSFGPVVNNLRVENKTKKG